MKRFLLFTGAGMVLVVIFLGGIGFFSFIGDDKMEQGRVHVHKPVQMPSSLPELKMKTLLFFGYVGCETVCTPRLHEIASIVKQYEHNSSHHDVSVLFVNLDTEATTAEADEYAKSFHPDFIGVTLPKKELLKMIRMFDAYFSEGLTNKKEIDHTQFLYLISKDSNGYYYVHNIYIKIPYDRPVILNDLKKEK